MPNRPHPDKQAISLRLHRDLVTWIHTETTTRGITTTDLIRILVEHERDKTKLVARPDNHSQR